MQPAAPARPRAFRPRAIRARTHALAAILALALATQTARADGPLTVHRIPAALANEAVAAAVAACVKQGYVETAVLVDADGVRQAVLRGDGAGPHTLDSAFFKAYTAVTFKAETTATIARAKDNPALTNLAAKLPNLVLAGGGVPIKLGDEVVGGIGASGAPGGDLDDACAKAGIAAIADRLK